MSFDLFHLDGENGFRGGERQLLYLAAALRERGHRNTVVCRASSPLALEAGRLGLDVMSLHCMAEWNVLAALAIRRRARRSPNPILHSHTGHAVALGVLAAIPGGLPHVAHRRVDFPLRGGLSALKYGRADAVVSVSAAISSILENDGLSSERLSVVCDAIPVGPEECHWAGLSADLYQPPTSNEKTRRREALAAEWDIDPSADWVGNLAALVPHKDHDNLIGAAILVLQRKPSTVFLIAGDGPEKSRLGAAILRTGFSDRIILLGRREPEDILKTADVFVLSSWGEGMGSVLLEAASCAIPIAATTAGGIPEVIEHGKTGLLAPPRDPESLAAHILKLLDDRHLARKLAMEAAEGLKNRSLSRMAESMERIYERVSLDR